MLTEKYRKNYADEESLSWTSSEKWDLDQDGESGRNYAPPKSESGIWQRAGQIVMLQWRNSVWEW